MPKVRKPEEAYKGRRFDCSVINVTIDSAANAILRSYCPAGNKNLGKLVSRIIHEFAAREEERQRMREFLGEPTKAE